MGRRLKVLISAYACSPMRGSEPGMGWGWVEALSHYHDLWIITEKDEFESEVEAGLNKRPELHKRMRFFYITKNRHRTLRKIWPPSFYWFYNEWHRKAYELAVRLHKEVNFDLFHQLNMIGYREPGYLWKINKPFVWGPVGGAGSIPVPFYPMLGIHGFLFHLCRNLVNAYQIRFNKRVKCAWERADIVVTATSDISDVFHKVLGRETIVINETGVNPSLKLAEEACPRSYHGGPIRFSWSGLHNCGKALPIALKALARLPKSYSWHLHILGNGPMTKKWQRLANKLGITPDCTWHGWVSQAEATRIVRDSDVFLFTSLSEGTPHVIMEALSMGVPVICLDHCGQKDIVTEECGVKIPAISPKQAVSDFASTIQRLFEKRGVLNILFEGAAKFAESETHSYATKAKLMSELYEESIEIFHAGKAHPKRKVKPSENLSSS